MQLPPRTAYAVLLGTLCAHGTVTSAEVRFEEEILVAGNIRPQLNRVTFSPDSRHIAYAVLGLKNNQVAYHVFADGREVLTLKASNLDNTPGAWEMDADGTLTLLGVDGGALKRCCIPAPADSTTASMLAAARS